MQGCGYLCGIKSGVYALATVRSLTLSNTSKAYEAAVAVGKLPGWKTKGVESDDETKLLDTYPMDFYAAGSPWANSRIRGSLD